MKLEKGKKGILIFLGICILLAGSSIGGGLNAIADSINFQDEETDDPYRMVVQDGIIYMYDTTTGQVWKKADKPDSKWEEVESLFGDW